MLFHLHDILKILKRETSNQLCLAKQKVILVIPTRQTSLRNQLKAGREVDKSYMKVN